MAERAKPVSACLVHSFEVLSQFVQFGLHRRSTWYGCSTYEEEGTLKTNCVYVCVCVCACACVRRHV